MCPAPCQHKRLRFACHYALTCARHNAQHRAIQCAQHPAQHKPSTTLTNVLSSMTAQTPRTIPG
eukprot:13660075-Ditylum_brightwellii.AAC.1